jgi:signal transduction histidine kinase
LDYFDFQSRIKHRSGKWIWVLDRGRVITRTPDGQPQMMFGTRSEITQSKKLEERLIKSRAKLQERVRDRTSELQSANDVLTSEISARKQVESQLAESLKELHALSQQIINAHEDERRAVARELHDEIGQSVTALKILVNQIERLAPNKREASLKEAGAIAGELVQRVREMSLNLRPSMLDDLGLLPTLIWHLGKYSTQTGVQVSFEHTGLPAVLPPEINITAYRIIQEALTNIARYARVKRAAVKISFKTGLLTVNIEDRGKGFALKETNIKATAGLSGMRERVLLLGGNMVLETAPGQGTRIRVELPVK